MKLYRHQNCTNCQMIEESLKEMVMSFETIYMKDYPKTDGLPEQQESPVLVDEGRVFEGERPIMDHLDELKKFREDWYKYQSDVCYCEE